MDWSLRGCSRKGHVTYAPDEEDLRSRLHVETPAGEAWRCLRCATFVVAEPQGSGPADEAPIVLRGRALKDATILRLLAAERFGRGLLLLALAYGVYYFKDAKTSVKRTFDEAIPAARPLAGVFNYDLDASPTVDRIRHVLDSSQHTLTLVTLGLLAYGLLQLVEGVGLWMLKRWGEYVAVVGTSAFLPLEVYELTDKVSVLKVGALLVNLVAVAYLVWSKRLFGVRGGHAAFEEERQAESLLEVETAALTVGGKHADARAAESTAAEN
ncbi:MAG: putative rane protein [Frankiales bacterium]|nr:putative rane protein [Frankiales bacterium]